MSLNRNLLECAVGGILNRFIARSRRITLFFDNIINDYISLCESEGYEGNTWKISKKWAELAFQQLVPNSIKRLPKPLIINHFGKKTWNSLGIVDDIHLDENGNTINLATRNESITRVIGENRFMLGFWNGTINALYSSQTRIVDYSQSKEVCRYQFEIENKPIYIEGREKSLYNRLNYLKPIKGFTLNDAIKKRILQLKEDNRIYFRNKRLTITENTIFHLAGNADIMIDKVPDISYNFFKDIVDLNSSNEQKLILLKNLLQIMGWGIVNIIIRNKNEVYVQIKNPPYGLQLEKDNWNFLCNTFLGYIWILDRDFEISDFREGYRDLRILYQL